MFVLLLFAGTASADLSPRLRMVARGQIPASGFAMPSDPARALVTVHVPGGAARMSGLGFSARSLGGDVVAMTLDRHALAALAALAPDAHFEERRILTPQLDRAAAMIGAPAARQATGLTGAGVLIGVIDTGADFRHADLRTETGATKIVALLDQSIPEDLRHQDLGHYDGAFWLRDEIDAVLAAEAAGQPSPLPIDEKDTIGHGTHVAAIATSTGLATGGGFPTGRYVGIAPGAELVIAQTNTPGGITDVHVLDACRFAIERAKALHRPLVVNLSLGASGSPHDGTTNVERGLDELFGRSAPGLALVVAAGNDGAEDLHAGGWALDGDATLPFAIGKGSPGGLALELWYRGAVSVALESPSGRLSPSVAPGATLDFTFPGEGRLAIDNGSAGAGANGLSGAGVVLNADSTLAPGTWRLVVTGRAVRYDAWLIESPALAVTRFVGGVVSDERVLVPATARSAIGVGSIVSRLDWTTHAGMAFVPPGADPARTSGPSSFSAPGPTSDGRFAPDVSAPGEYILAAMSRDATPDVPTSVFHGIGADMDIQWSDDGQHGVLRGTSQAAPMVAGVIALLFEADPTLTSDRVRELLRVGARTVPGTANGWSPRSGFGRVDPARTLAYLRGERGTLPSPRRSGVGVSRDILPPGTDETTRVTVTPRDESDRPLGPGRAVEITLSAGAAVGPVVDTGGGRYERAFIAHAARGAIGVTRVVVDGVALDAAPRVFFVPSRAEVGQQFVAGGGCDASGGHARALAPTLLLIVAWMFARRRRVRGLA